MIDIHNKNRFERIQKDIASMDLETIYGTTFSNPFVIKKNSIKVRNYILFMSSILEGSKTRADIIKHTTGKKYKAGMYNATFTNLLKAGMIQRNKSEKSYELTPRGDEYLDIFGKDKLMFSMKLEF